MAKAEDNLVTRTKILFNAKDISGEFYRTSFTNLFTYVSNRIPEISDTLYQIDEAVKAGFGWKLGPFETWDAVGLDAAIALIEESGNKPKQWVYEMKESGIDSFYKIENGLNYFYDIESKSYKIQNRVLLSRYRGKTLCTQCKGNRLRKETDFVNITDKELQLALYKINHLPRKTHNGKTAHEVYYGISKK